MSLSAFIRDHHEEIISEFAVFAKTLMPPGTEMTEAELRDHAEDILTAVVRTWALRRAATNSPSSRRVAASAKTMQASGKLHADDRIQHGFTFRSVLAEFRALRATVLRLYENSGESDLTDVRRFNEAIDEAMTESMDRFAVQTDLFRDQFIGVLSHDLRTPLAAVTAGAALLAVPEDNPQRRASRRRAHHEQRATHGADDRRSLGPDARQVRGINSAQPTPADLQAGVRGSMIEIRAGQPDAVVRVAGERGPARRVGRRPTRAGGVESRRQRDTARRTERPSPSPGQERATR